jgi:CheY-like chemotaxis protein
MTRRLAGRRVLVVEDELLVSWLLEEMLVDLGCTVAGSAGHVAGALALIETAAVDAAVLDVNLNGEMSYPVADALVARGVPFLFSSGYHKDRLREGYGGHPMLQKPFHISDLDRALTSLFPASTPVAPAT